jgi:hypothetical protein
MTANTGATRNEADDQRTMRFEGSFAGLAGASILDGCRDAAPVRASMPLRGRLDLKDRSVVVTARMGGAMVLQRIGLNAYEGVAAELVMNEQTDAWCDGRMLRRCVLCCATASAPIA